MRIVVALVAALFSSWLLTRVTLRHALARQVLDIPNERSSHRTPTPRGGGIAVVVVSSVSFICLALAGSIELRLLWALLGGLTVAAVGFADDVRPVRASTRLTVHAVAAAWAIMWLGGLPPIRFGHEFVSLGVAGYVLGAIVITWTLNLFNFMDGIDGIAGAEAVFIACSGAALTYSTDWGAATAALLFGGACCGFLWWNWPPARIFMGDTGSGYIGFVIAVLAIASARSSPVLLWVWLILGGAFFVDATVTLIRRMTRGERAHEAHRSHAYQWLARRWGSHHPVTVAFIVLNCIWLLPAAVLAALYPQRAAWIVLPALAVLVVLALIGGAGRKE
jgi:Fuc2NAc and GlcNAc transferase